MRIRVEYWLLVSFLLGILVAYAVPIKVGLFSAVTDSFVAAFMFFAPAIVFVIVFDSTCSLLLEREITGRVIRASVILFALLVLGCSLFASIVLLAVSPSSVASAWLSNETFSYVGQVILTSLLRPVTLALLLGVIIALALSHTSFFKRAVDLSKRTYGLQERAFRLLLRIFPIITMSLGAGLYYALGTVSIEVYVTSMGLTLLLGLAALAILFVIVQKVARPEIKELAGYSMRIFATGLSIGSSYIILPLALRAFKEHFAVDNAVGDLVLTLGASLNRCGSVMGVLVVTSMAARYTGLEASWQQMLLLAIPVALIGFGSPGIQGGTLLVAMPVILHVVNPLDPAKFVTVALALFVGGTTFIQAAVNTVSSGYVALLVDRQVSKLER
jgi:Na+/H+-dicarboxylate symporter